MGLHLEAIQLLGIPPCSTALMGSRLALDACVPATCQRPKAAISPNRAGSAVMPSQMDTVAGDPRPQADQLDELPARVQLMDSVVQKHRRALIKDKMRVMEFLEENGFESSNVNSRKQKWKIFSTYPLHEAVKQGNHQMVDLLLKFGANVHTTDYRWRSAFALAQQKQDRAAMEVFQRRGLSPSSPYFRAGNKMKCSPSPIGWEEFFAKIEKDPILQR
ncbi:unnamed protein product [Durusdinium trenchii]|uniref:Uncharacterized protein n=1 Tax=Durusdinium trenchii TaxID=1381693 RepID=A0ABP0MDC5_9DINO